jgi:hypothetical protein
MATGYPPEPARTDRCQLCRGELGATWMVTPLGERYCLAHEHTRTCRVCVAPVGSATAVLCHRCDRTAVHTQDQVRAAVPQVRQGLHRMGLRLATPVRVRLVGAAEMARMSRVTNTRSGATLGLTVYTDTQVVDLVILAGLSSTEFGAVVAHECMHAWMAQRGFGDVAPPTAEGLCELAADGWLEQQDDPRARILRAAIAADPDPVYGDGFRQVRQSVRRHGLVPVLRAVRSGGGLP